MVISYQNIKQSINLYVLKDEESKNVKIATYALGSKLSPHFDFILSSTSM